MRNRTLLLLLSLVSMHAVFAQADTAFRNKQIASVRSSYMNAAGVNSFLYTGEAYDHYWNLRTGHPFLDGDLEFTNGSLNYDGSQYDNVPLAYDIYHDELVTKQFHSEVPMKFLDDKVRSFSFNGRYFVRVWKDSLERSSPATGYYEVIYSGKKVTILARHEKLMKNSIQSGESVALFKEQTHYFVMQQGRYREIGSERELLNLWVDRKTELRKFLGRKDINFKQNPASAFARAAAYYEEISK